MLCRVTTIGVWLAAMLLTLSGCQGPAAQLEPVRIPTDHYAPYFDAAAEALRNEGYRVDRRDHRFGVVTSEPLDSSTAMEPWRPSNHSLGDALDSTLNQQRRIASVHFEDITTDRGATVVAIDVAVKVQRLEIPRAYLTGSTAGGRVFGMLSSQPEELRARGIEGAYWRDLGRDPLAEAEIRSRLLEHAQATLTSLQPLAEPAQPTE